MEKKAITLAKRSIEEWIASEITLTEPINIPTITLKTINVVLENIDNNATFCLFNFIHSFQN